MKRYFKPEGESNYGVAVVCMELADDWPSRQAEVYGEIWRWGDHAGRPRYAHGVPPIGGA